MSRESTIVLKHWFKFFPPSLSSVTILPQFTKEMFVVLTPLPERRAVTVFQKSLLSIILFKSRLLKYFFFPLLYSILQKHRCRLKSFKFLLDTVLKYLCCCCVLFIIAFLKVFVTYDGWLALIVLFSIEACLPKSLTKIFSKACYDKMFCNSLRVFKISLKFCFIKQYKI